MKQFRAIVYNESYTDVVPQNHLLYIISIFSDFEVKLCSQSMPIVQKQDAQNSSLRISMLRMPAWYLAGREAVASRDTREFILRLNYSVLKCHPSPLSFAFSTSSAISQYQNLEGKD